ncbi:MAG: DEAD/DEAH box helicase [Thermoleophilaceae bacterium]
MSEPVTNQDAPPLGSVTLRGDGTRDAELVFAFPRDDELNAAVKELPGRWFDWRRRHWRVPADPRVGPALGELLAQFPSLVAAPEVRAWMSDSHRWRGIVSVSAQDGRGTFVVRTLSGDEPDELPEGHKPGDGHLLLVAFDADTAERLQNLKGADLDDPARACARELRAGRAPAPAELAYEVDDDGEPQLVLSTVWDSGPATDFAKLSEARRTERYGRYFRRDSGSAVAVPADPAMAEQLLAFAKSHPQVTVETPAREVLEELRVEFERASATVALSYAEDAELRDLGLGGVLHPFQRAGVRYALEQRQTFIADEQGLGKTVQALATLEADDAFPAIVVCPASMKLIWEREAGRWLPERTVHVVQGRGDRREPPAATPDLTVLNYDILEAHSDALVALEPKALVLDESHYVKNPGAQRTKAALELVQALPEDALRLALTGTPILNRPEELVAQLRVLGRLKEFGSGARLTRRFKRAASDDRLHWNLRAHCYVRRTKQQVLPQLPAKRQETVPVLLSNEKDYRLAESDVIAWLQSLPLDLRSIDAKVAAALRAEQLVRLNQLRQLAASGKLPTALAWISDFLASGEPLVVFAEHRATQRAVLDRFPDAAHILGSDSGPKRQEAIDAFQSEDGVQLIVCSMRAASQGITLTRASNVAFLELDWTPARHDQAEDRLHRIGQDSAVTAWYLLAPDTIDETMAELLERKRTLIGAVTDGQVRDEERLVDAVVRDLRARPYRHLRVVA